MFPSNQDPSPKEEEAVQEQPPSRGHPAGGEGAGEATRGEGGQKEERQQGGVLQQERGLRAPLQRPRPHLGAAWFAGKENILCGFRYVDGAYLSVCFVGRQEGGHSNPGSTNSFWVSIIWDLYHSSLFDSFHLVFCLFTVKNPEMEFVHFVPVPQPA